MAHHVIRMPDIGEGIAEVEIVAWHVKPGDPVTEDQTLADVMTDKATVAIPSPVVGSVVSLGGKVGEPMAVGAELIRIEVAGQGNVKDGDAESAAAPVAASAAAGAPTPSGAKASLAPVGPGSAVASMAPASSAVGASPASAPAGAARATPVAAAAGGAAVPASGMGLQAPSAPMSPRPTPRAASPGPSQSTRAWPARAPDERPLASPAVRRRALELGIDLRFVPASGPAGRITHEDLDAWRDGSGQVVGTRSGYQERHDETAIPIIGLRRRIAQKMQEAKRRIPHFSYVEEVDVTELELLRTKLNARYAAERGKLTLLPLIARAVVLAVREFPQLNARFDDDAGVVTRYGAVQLGIAAQTDAGLMVPVVRHAEALDLWACAAEIGRLAEATRTGTASRDELTGSTITITSLGSLGGIVTTPVINHPEVAIVGVNRIVERPVILNGAVVARSMMNLSSSFDHRVVDGMDAARFVQAIRASLESPALLLVE